MWKAFHHHDVSLPVVRRRPGLELLELLDFLGDMAVHHVHAFLRHSSSPKRSSCYNAVSRLAKQGLLVKERGRSTPFLSISQTGNNWLEPYFHPEGWWSRKWNGTWYLLVYDVPERDRSYRNALRHFLKRQRMGCFQKSVWITPHDIRPQYADLEEVAAVNRFACLFKAHTLPGMSIETVVKEAWDFEILYVVQKRFCDIYSHNLKILTEAESLDLDSVMRLTAEEIDAYRSAFVNDPLLPDPLLPNKYFGKQAYSLHQEVIRAIRKRIEDL